MVWTNNPDAEDKKHAIAAVRSRDDPDGGWGAERAPEGTMTQPSEFVASRLPVDASVFVVVVMPPSLCFWARMKFATYSYLE